jgi:hypothetical protein
MADEIGVLAPHAAFPLGFLLQVVLPGDGGIVRRGVAAILHALADRLVQVGDPPSRTATPVTVDSMLFATE